MTARLNPYLAFKDDARAAMEFYQQVFGGELTVNTFGEYGTSGPEADKVMHAHLETPSGFTLMASDVPQDVGLESGSSITISLSGDASDGLESYWQQLSDGGTVTMPLEKQMWGDTFGMCTDRFGIAWMVNITASEAAPFTPADSAAQG